MDPVLNLMRDLDAAIMAGSTARREITLRQVTELFVGDADRLTEEQVGIFDSVIARLAQEIEREARADLARRLAALDRAPPGVIRSLAHDEIEVARPVLIHSPRLGDPDLVSVAISRSCEHQRAIAQRREVSEPVAELLVTRGSRPVLHTLAGNAGARLTAHSAAVLVDQARLDEELQSLLKARRDLPQDQVHRLFDLARAAAHRRLVDTTPRDLHGAMEQALARGAKRVRSVVAGSLDYRDALEVIGAIELVRPIDEEDIAGFAVRENLEEAICAIASGASLSLTMAERLFTVADSDLILIVGKAKGWSWETLEALLRLRDPDALLPHNAKRLSDTFENLAPRTAERVLRVVRRRDQEAAA